MFINTWKRPPYLGDLAKAKPRPQQQQQQAKACLYYFYRYVLSSWCSKSSSQQLYQQQRFNLSLEFLYRERGFLPQILAKAFHERSHNGAVEIIYTPVSAKNQTLDVHHYAAAHDSTFVFSFLLDDKDDVTMCW